MNGDEMIFGIGVDITSVARSAQSLERFGDKFVRRVLSDVEIEAFQTSNQPERFLAKRFAIKEAASKALGTGIRDGVSFHDFVTEHDAMGKPELCVSGRAAERCEQFGITRFHLSLSDEGDTVVAYVVMECGA